MKVVELFRFVLPANLLGLPAVCVPTGVANGLPTGAQIIGDLFREDLCLNAARAIGTLLGVLTAIDPGPRAVDSPFRPITRRRWQAAVAGHPGGSRRPRAKTRATLTVLASC